MISENFYRVQIIYKRKEPRRGWSLLLCQVCFVDKVHVYYSLFNFFFNYIQINFAQPAEVLHNFIRGNDKVSTK